VSAFSKSSQSEGGGKDGDDPDGGHHKIRHSKGSSPQAQRKDDSSAECEPGCAPGIYVHSSLSKSKGLKSPFRLNVAPDVAPEFVLL
jgi:hypothetical protein